MAIVGASLALLIIYGVKVEPVDKVLKDVDWKTLLFLTCMFLMVEAIHENRHPAQPLPDMVAWFGNGLLTGGNGHARGGSA